MLLSPWLDLRMVDRLPVIRLSAASGKVRIRQAVYRRGMKLLLVEDDPSMQTALKRTLLNRGIAVELCSDGRQALERWKAAPPDVVLLDLTLPGMDGLLVLEHARRSGLATPVLILTARGTVGDRIIGLNTGADDYLAKPFDLDELEARLRALQLGGRIAVREVQAHHVHARLEQGVEHARPVGRGAEGGEDPGAAAVFGHGKLSPRRNASTAP
jgi:DNA-binding response OmpR family regulator